MRYKTLYQQTLSNVFQAIGDAGKAKIVKIIQHVNNRLILF